MAKKIAKEKLEAIQALNTEFNKTKSQLGDLELQKYSIMKRIEQIKTEFQEHEKSLMEKYGETAELTLRLEK